MAGSVLEMSFIGSQSFSNFHWKKSSFWNSFMIIYCQTENFQLDIWNSTLAADKILKPLGFPQYWQDLNARTLIQFKTRVYIYYKDNRFILLKGFTELTPILNIHKGPCFIDILFCCFIVNEHTGCISSGFCCNCVFCLIYEVKYREM